MNSDRRIRSDWFDLRQVYDNLKNLHEYLGIDSSHLNNAREELRLSVETGLLQYKHVQLGLTVEFIETLKYDTRHFNQLEYQCIRTTLLLFVILIQRLLVFGIIPLSQPNTPPPVEDGKAQGKDIKQIMEELRRKAMTDPAFAQRNEVKSILLQFKIYQKELEEMQRLKAKVPKEKLSPLLINFQKTFTERNRKIRENYSIVMTKEHETSPTTIPPGNLKKYQLKTMAPLLIKQGEEASRLRSRFQIAQEERYNTRKIFDKALKIVENLRETFSEEEALMGRWEPAPMGAALVSKGFAKELNLCLEKLLTTV